MLYFKPARLASKHSNCVDAEVLFCESCYVWRVVAPINDVKILLELVKFINVINAKFA